MTESAGQSANVPEVFELEGSCAGEAVDLLVLAFERDPAYRYICSAERPGYLRRLRVVFGAIQTMHLGSGQPVLGVLSGDRLGGLALIQKPGASVSVWAQLRWVLKTGLCAGPRAPWRSFRDVRIAERERPSEPHFYLPVLAVHPEFHGLGYGRTLLEAVHARSERHPQSAGVCLETENPDNVPFYEHLGYRVTARNPLSDLQIATLFRARESEFPVGSQGRGT